MAKPITQNPWLALLQVTRPWNLLMIGVAMVIFGRQVAGMPIRSFGWAIAAMMCIAGAGNVINDYFDQREDRINKPRKALVGRVLKRRWALGAHHALAASALLLSSWGSHLTGSYVPLIWSIFLGGLLAAYSPFFKRRFLRGNLLIACAVGQLPLWTGMVLSVEGEVIWWILVGFAGISGWLTLIREVTKDLQDCDGDKEWGYDTLPIRWKTEKTVRLLHALMVPTAIALFGVTWIWAEFSEGAGWWTLAFNVPFLGAWLQLQRRDIRRLSAWLKLTMAGGLIALAMAPPIG